MNELQLKIEEIPQQHVGKGRAIIDSKIIEDTNWDTGQILEFTYHKKTHVKLWPGSPEDYGSGIIKIDGITRHNIGGGIGDKVTVKSVEAGEAEQIVLSPTEKLSIDEAQLHEVMLNTYQNHVFKIHDSIVLPTHMGGKIQFIITNTKPVKPVIVTENTIFKLGSMTKAVDTSIPRITYDELGGLKNEVQKIREMVELPMRHPELFEKIGVEAPKGVLLYGPPGTGKTLLAKAVAGETNANFTSISGPEIMGKFYGESEERLREFFKQAEENAPSIIFIDEIDSIAPKREEVSGEVEKRIVSQLLTLMDGMKSRGKVVVIAATNRPDSLDPALRRPGRFDREIEIVITNEDFRDSLKEVRPSALREVMVQTPNVTWDDVGGLESLKEELREAIEWPIKHKEAFEYVDVQAPKGILLHGPPGTGKTLIAKAVAKMTESNFISIKGPELLSKWVGESEKGVREIFRKARQVAPCIVFLDEVDALIPRRGDSSDSHVTQNVVSQILTEIDGLRASQNVLIIGATNRIDIIDPAILRPGRFDRIIEVPLPDSKGRENIFKIHTKKKPLAKDVDLGKLVDRTDGFSGAEIAAIANRAGITALKRYVSGKSHTVKEIEITQKDLMDAIEKVKPKLKKTEEPLAQTIK